MTSSYMNDFLERGWGTSNFGSPGDGGVADTGAGGTSTALSPSRQRALADLNGDSGGGNVYYLDQIPGVGTVLINRQTGAMQAVAGEKPAAPHAAAAPPTPRYQYTVNPVSGQVMLFNDLTGQFTETGIAGGEPAALVRQYKQQEAADDRAFQRELQGLAQDFTGLQNDADRRMALLKMQSEIDNSVGEGNANRAFQSSESYLDRAARVSEMNELSKIRDSTFRLSAHQYITGVQREYERDRDARRMQFAQLVSLPDVAALPAFLAAGGGNLSNALADGRTNLTNNAMAPAADAWRSLEEGKPPDTSAIQALLNAPPPRPYVLPPYQAPTPRPSPFANPFAPPSAQPPAAPGGGISASPSYVNAPRLGTEGAAATNAGLEGAGMVRDENGRYVFPEVRAAATGMNETVTEPTMILAGEAGSPEHVQVTPLSSNAKALNPVQPPESKIIEAQSRPADPMTAAATGQPTTAPSYLQPYIDRVRAFRQAIQAPNLRALGVQSRYDPKYALLSPLVRQTYENALQTNTGVPASEFAHEAEQYRLRGITPGASRFGA